MLNDGDDCDGDKNNVISFHKLTFAKSLCLYIYT
jgi:hypothetical protein